MCSTPVKGCLKQPSPTPTPMLECPHARKCVAFEAEGCEQIFLADEWDRTPTEPTRKLSYQDLMELREIQRSLPLANQPPDPVTGRAARQYLSTVPITLLPLLPEAENCNKGTTNATHVQAPGYSRTPPHRNLHAAATKSRAPDPSHLTAPAAASHSISPHRKISNPTARRFGPNFTFLPLLDTPSPSSESSGATTPLASNSSSRSTSPDLPSDTDQTDPPTPSLTNASLDSPTSCASSLSPEPSFLQLPPRHLGYGDERFHHFGPADSYFPIVSDDVDMGGGDNGDDDLTPGRSASKRPFPVSPHSAKKPAQPSGASLPIIAAIKPARKRNVMVVNGEEIDLDDDEDQDEDRRSASNTVSETPKAAAAAIPGRKRNVIIINGEEVEIDDEEPSQSSSSDQAPSKFPSISTLSTMTKLDSHPRSISLSAPDRHCNSTKNDKPPEPKARTEIKALPPSCLPSPPLTPSIDDDGGSRPGRRSPPTPQRNQTSNGSFGSTAKSGGKAIGCGAEEFGLHIPLRFKRRTMSMEAPNSDSDTARNRAPFPYTGSS